MATVQVQSPTVMGLWTRILALSYVQFLVFNRGPDRVTGSEVKGRYCVFVLGGWYFHSISADL